MEPAIHLGSVVVVDRSDRVPQVGAIVTFHDPPGGVVTHRVVAIGPSSFQTKGDANNSVDVTAAPPLSSLGPSGSASRTSDTCSTCSSSPWCSWPCSVGSRRRAGRRGAARDRRGDP